ncbi:hypothetical protein FHX82_003817 [Amycolatopsis bartoniae]|uniref:Uncharacterized protein n=1 Tax=Amycolatopsis bartoniae TaxID=941986 RepID=A0A8H9IR88_9PSEU|nr:hypothetical protein [Amycolatopsis bartoniae]MBB2936753.1 hypothetical protein [Amycolatopsis bartoniae]TVT09196.1 hypothetical protein FNH07_09875 [Amycolatopsis bartoniae]GHF49891.1 hypothetical protein GCM10017566_23670 [Amycolatopsis bartoniae]
MSLSVVRGARRRRWAVVVVVAVLLVAVPLVVSALRPAGHSLDAARLRDLVLASESVPYQGYAQSTGSLALPQLPDLADVSALFSTTTTTHAWYAAPDRYRVAVLTTGGERDLYRLPEGEYTWDYGADQLTELQGEAPVRLPRAADLLPPELARRILRTAPRDAVTTLPARRVAGIAASGLRLVPADSGTTIGQVDVWADPGSGLPLRVEVTARGQRAPILVSEFQQVGQTAPVVTAPVPAPSSGFTVTTAPDLSRALNALGQVRLPGTLAGRRASQTNVGIQGAALYGEGLATFAAVAIPRNVADSAADAAAKAGAATVPLTFGDAVLLSIAPLSLAVVRPPGGRRAFLLAGLVTPAVLQAAGEDLTHLPRSFR